jgi:hypothetical protein
VEASKASLGPSKIRVAERQELGIWTADLLTGRTLFESLRKAKAGQHKFFFCSN